MHPHFDNHEQSRIAAGSFVRTVYVHSISQSVGSVQELGRKSNIAKISCIDHILVGIEMELGGNNSTHFLTVLYTIHTEIGHYWFMTLNIITTGDIQCVA